MHAYVNIFNEYVNYALVYFKDMTFSFIFLNIAVTVKSIKNTQNWYDSAKLNHR